MRPLSWPQAEPTGPTVGEVVRQSDGIKEKGPVEAESSRGEN